MTESEFDKYLDLAISAWLKYIYKVNRKLELDLNIPQTKCCTDCFIR